MVYLFISVQKSENIPHPADRLSRMFVYILSRLVKRLAQFPPLAAFNMFRPPFVQVYSLLLRVTFRSEPAS